MIVWSTNKLTLHIAFAAGDHIERHRFFYSCWKNICVTIVRIKRSCKNCTSSVIRQKGESQNRCLKKKKHAKFSKKQIILTPWYTYVYVSGVRNVRFSEDSACFLLLKHPFWDLPFCLITDDLWYVEKEQFFSRNIYTITYSIKKSVFESSMEEIGLLILRKKWRNLFLPKPQGMALAVILHGAWNWFKNL